MGDYCILSLNNPSDSDCHVFMDRLCLQLSENSGFLGSTSETNLVLGEGMGA